MLNKVLNAVEKNGVRSMAYADDVVLISLGKFLDVIGDLSTRIFRRIIKSARTKGLNKGRIQFQT